jgi:hypothetical protein
MRLELDQWARPAEAFSHFVLPRDGDGASGCFLERQYCAFTGTVRGQNSREFVARLVARGFVRVIEPGPVRRGRLYAGGSSA